ncbi:MAG TPA: hypothetical protein VM841_00490 [Actinomycetota bacterium]|nr:hypothetical protein [Actinomycetota bacterium]
MSWENGTPGAGAPVASGEASNGEARPRAAAEIEAGLADIAGVRAARVVTGEDGHVAEVHVLASPGRPPKQLVRDIQSAVLTRFGITIDYRVVSVVQLEREVERQGPAPTAAAAAARPVLRRLSAETASFSTEIKVGLALEGTEIDRTTRGPATAGLRLVASATVDAVAEALSAEGVEVEFAAVVAAGPRQVALVVLRVLTGRGDQVVSGSAVIRRDPGDAVARATLAALNRFVGS